MFDWSLFVYGIGLLSATVTAVWWLAWWFARQFSNVKNVIYETKEAILSKLEYHEQHDDQRFAEVRKDIWEIRLRNAVIDGRYAERERIKQLKIEEKKEI